MKLVIVSLLVFSLLLFGCTSPYSTSTGTPSTISAAHPSPAPSPISSPQPQPAAAPPAVSPSPAPSPSPTSTANSSASQSPVKEFSLTAKQWEFQPSTITVKRGDHVKLTIRSTDVTHGFALPDFNVNSRLEPGQDTIVEFDATRTGTFTFFCSVFCGSGHGSMRGSLVVEP